MLSSLPILLGALGALPFAAATVINGSGTISVLVGANHTTSYDTATPSDTVGCINAAGQVVLSDCATFTFANSHVVNNNTGVCSFSNTTQPTNTEDVYGSNIHALHCWQHTAASAEASFYTVDGLPYTFLGTGDVDLYYDIPSIPASEDDQISIWYFVWGDQSATVPEGHSKAMLLWEPTSTS